MIILFQVHTHNQSYTVYTYSRLGAKKSNDIYEWNLPRITEASGFLVVDGNIFFITDLPYIIITFIYIVLHELSDGMIFFFQFRMWQLT